MLKFSREVLGRLSKRDKSVYAILASLLALSNFLDLLGASMLGIVVVRISGVEESNSAEFLNTLADFFVNIDFIRNNLLYFLVTLALFFFITKALFSNFVNFKTLNFLAHRDALVSESEFLRYFLTHTPAKKSNSLPEITVGLTGAVTGIVVRFLSNLQTFFVEIVLITLFTISLIVAGNYAFFLIMIFFAVLTFFVTKFLSKQSQNSVKVASDHLIKSQEQIQNSFYLHREILLSSELHSFAEKFRREKLGFAKETARNVWLSQLPRYVYEIALLLGLFLATLLTTNFASKNQAYFQLGVALIAISRVVPSLLRLVTATLGMRSAMGQSDPLLKLLADGNSNSNRSVFPQNENTEVGLGLSVSNLSFQHDSQRDKVIDEISINLKAGKSLAIVGPSGIGKSTLVDLLLGFVLPESGGIYFDGLSPALYQSRYPSGVRLIPQKSYLIKGSIRDNLTLFTHRPLSDSDLMQVASVAELNSFISAHQDGLDRILGADGLGLSGGEKQRIAIARALIDRPSYLILDEATNALQDTLEIKVIKNILQLPWSISVILITHNMDVANLCDIKIDLKIA